jgi:hypothetical protein
MLFCNSISLKNKQKVCPLEKIIREIKLEIRWVGNAARMADVQNVYKGLRRKCDGKDSCKFWPE